MARPRKHEPTHYEPASLDEKVLLQIAQEGAVSKSGIVKRWGCDSDAALASIRRLIYHGRLVWISALPRQYVFFTTPDHSGQYGYPLMSQYKAGKGTRKKRQASTRVQDLRARLTVWLTENGQATAQQIAEELDLRYEVVRRHLEALAHKGIVHGAPFYTGERGRPAWVWNISDEPLWVDDTDLNAFIDTTVMLTDDEHVVQVNGHQLSAATRADTREGGL